MENKNQIAITEEVADFSNIGKQSRKNKENGKIPTESYNRKVLTYSQLTGEIYEKLTGKDANAEFTSFLLSAIGKENPKVLNFLQKNRNLTQEFSKPTTTEEAKQGIDGLNKVREYLNKNYNLALRKLESI